MGLFSSGRNWGVSSLPVLMKETVEDWHFQDGKCKVGIECKVGLAWVFCGHGLFSPQLWFVYFDLENCAQFLSDHVQEMKMSHEVSVLQHGSKQQAREMSGRAGCKKLLCLWDTWL